MSLLYITAASSAALLNLALAADPDHPTMAHPTAAAAAAAPRLFAFLIHPLPLTLFFVAAAALAAKHLLAPSSTYSSSAVASAAPSAVSSAPTAASSSKSCPPGARADSRTNSLPPHRQRPACLAPPLKVVAAHVVRCAPNLFDFALQRAPARLRLDIATGSLVEYDAPPLSSPPPTTATAAAAAAVARAPDAERAALLQPATTTTYSSTLSASASSLSSSSSASSSSSSSSSYADPAAAAPDHHAKSPLVPTDISNLNARFAENVCRLAVADRGMHLKKGCAVALRVQGGDPRVVVFASRRAADAFAHAFAHAVCSASPTPRAAAAPASSALVKELPMQTQTQTQLQTRAMTLPHQVDAPVPANADVDADASTDTGTGAGTDADPGAHANVVADTDPDVLRLFVTTFNVGEARPPDDLSPWLARARDADIVAVGVQECSYSLPSDDSDDDDEYEDCSGTIGYDAQRSNDDVPQMQPDAHAQGTGLQKGVLSATEEGDRELGGEEMSSAHALPNRNGLVHHKSEDKEADVNPTHGEQNQQQPQHNQEETQRRQEQRRRQHFASDKEHWHALLAANLTPGEFDCVVQHAAWNRSLCIFTRRSLQPFITKARVDTANVGIGGVAGNKGAIAARFSVHDTSFLIVNSHLAAHHGEVARRNGDFAAIAGGLHNLRDEGNAGLDALSDAVHHTIWLGDLNYRVGLPRDDVLRLAVERDWAKLQAADQLRAEMKAGRVFQGFQEGITDFAPTYRYERGSRRYSEYKRRIPSYCDRVLFRSLPSCPLELLEYDACDDITTSDHSPVWATLTARLARTTGRVPLDSLTDGLEEGGKINVDAEKDGIIALDTVGENAETVAATAQTSVERSVELPAKLRVERPLGKEGQTRSRLLTAHFRGLQARGIPAMEFPGRRMAVAKALYLDGALAWKKHVDEGEGHQADPYCVFHGAAVCEVDDGAADARTTTVQMSQNPLWKPDEIPTVALVDSRRDVLAHRHLVVSVWDENISRADRLIGAAIVSLAPAADSKPVNFTVPIRQAGGLKGELSGEFVVR